MSHQPNPVIFRAIVTCTILIAGALTGTMPEWWVRNQVLIPNGQADDFAALNQGQLKHLMKAASAEMLIVLGAGNSIPPPAVNTPSADDFAVVTFGQLKAAVKPYYSKLVTNGQLGELPTWLESVDADDFAVANIGQAKNAFSFAILPLPQIPDPAVTEEEIPSNEQPGNQTGGNSSLVSSSQASTPLESACSKAGLRVYSTLDLIHTIH